MKWLRNWQRALKKRRNNSDKCDHCVAGATKAINEIEGASAKVNLRKKQAIVSYDREITDESIIEAVEKAGFKVEEIK